MGTVTDVGRTLARWQLMETSTLARILGLGLLIAALAAGLVFLPVERITGLLQWIEERGAWGPAFLGAFYIVGCLLFAPGSILITRIAGRALAETIPETEADQPVTAAEKTNA